MANGLSGRRADGCRLVGVCGVWLISIALFA